MKRFYKTVSYESQDSGGFVLLLDGRPVKTQGGKPLSAPSEALAKLAAQEWAQQSEEIVPDSMPITQILSTCIDRVAAQRDAMSENVLAYLDTDLLCYRADTPPELARRQAGHWDAPLAWFCKRFDVKMATTTALSALSQPRAAHEKLRAAIDNMDDEHFTALQLVTALSGSVILGLALVEGQVNAQTVFDAARVEENFKDEVYDARTYGPDPAEAKKNEVILRDLKAAQEFLKLL